MSKKLIIKAPIIGDMLAADSSSVTLGNSEFENIILVNNESVSISSPSQVSITTDNLNLEGAIINANQDGYGYVFPEHDSELGKTKTVALDEDIVHNTGDESIYGLKTFYSGLFVYPSSDTNSNLYLYAKNSGTTESDIIHISGGGTSIKLISGNMGNATAGGSYLKLSLGANASIPSEANIIFPHKSGTVATENYVDDAIAALPEPMIFKGSVGNGGTVEWDNLPSPTAGNTGWTYKAITKHTTAPICEIGDTIISDGSTWWVIPSGDVPDGTVTSVGTAAEANSGLTLTGGPITSSGTITVGLDSGYELLNSNTAQTIAGAKTFTGAIKYNNSNYHNSLTLTSSGYKAQLKFAGDGHNATNVTLETVYLSDTTDTTVHTQQLQNKDGTIALTSDIPAVSLTTTAGSEAIIVNSDTLNVVTRDTAQTLTGKKTFNVNNGERTAIEIINTTTTGEAIAIASDGIRIDGPNSAADDCCAVYTYNGISGKDIDDDNFDLYFPFKKSGTIALTSDIPDVDDFVTGPSSSTTDCIALFSGGNGKALKNGPLKVTENSSTRTVTITSGAGSNYITLGPSSGSVTTLASFSATANIIGHASNTHDAFYGSGYNSLIDLGTSSNKWTDLYLSGSLKDGTNSITIAQLVAAQAIPVCPTTTDGNYILRATVNNGAVTYEWVEDNFVRLS